MSLFPLLFAGISFAFGLAVLRLVKVRWFVPELVAGSFVAGLLACSWLILLAVNILGYRWGVSLGIGITAAGAIALWFLSRRRFDFQRPFIPEYSALALWLGMTLVTTAVLGWLIVSHMLFVRDGAYFSGGSTWGDLGLHMSLVSRFANQSAFTWDLPIYAEANLTYPFLLDFMSGILLRWQASPQTALLVPSLIFLFSFIQLFFFVAYRLFRSAGAAVLGIFLFLANGSPGGITAFWSDWRASGQNIFSFLLSMEKEYAHLADLNLRFSNIVVDYFIPQRGILVGVAAFMLVTLLWWRAYKENRQHAWPLLLASAIVGGLLPLAHVHTFFTLLGILIWFVVWHAWQQKSLANPWTYALLIMVGLAAPQVVWQMIGNFSEGFSYWKFGWLTPAGQSVLVFWLRNIGLGLVLLITNFWYINTLKQNKDFHTIYYAPLVALFLITNLYIFQPHEYDNMKFMVFSYIGLSLYSGAFLTHWLRRKQPYPIIAAVVIVSLTVVGVLSLLRETYTQWEFNVAKDVSTAATVRALIPPDARLLTSDQHNHFITTLVGRPIVMGYRGWLWTYGIDYSEVEKDVRTMFAGADGTPNLLKEYNVSFVVIGPSERSGFSPNEEYFAQNSRAVLQTPTYSIYDVRALRQ